MLVLSRKAGEEIVVPACRLTVTVLSIEGKKVRLGISAPRGIACIALRSWTELPLPLFTDKLRFQCWRTLMSIHILIADPDEYVLDSYREHLEQHGFDVVTATNGLDCVHRLRDSTPDVLVLDPVLPCPVLVSRPCPCVTSQLCRWSGRRSELWRRSQHLVSPVIVQDRRLSDQTAVSQTPGRTNRCVTWVLTT